MNKYIKWFFVYGALFLVITNVLYHFEVISKDTIFPMILTMFFCWKTADKVVDAWEKNEREQNE